ncbi:hypothetical protein [Singulisphaera sp. PoT]|uniref:hypothetical protein n=1 Tax=Singulisphaera sp. PoT TaxID=3411797 RepID=UPI003BF49792
MTIARSKSFSLATLMILVSLVAVDGAVLKYCWGIKNAAETAIVTLPMANLLLMTVPRLKGNTGAYWGGFHLAGWLSILGIGCIAWYENLWLWPVNQFVRILSGQGMTMESMGPTAFFGVIIAFVIVLYTSPLILLSMLAASISASWARRRGRDRS